MMSFNGFVHKYNSKNKTTTNIKTQKILSSLPLSVVKLYLRDRPFPIDVGVVCCFVFIHQKEHSGLCT